MPHSQDGRADARGEVAALTPYDALEVQHRDRVLAWIDAGAELYRVVKPATPPMHLVSYFVGIDEDHVLLVDHRDAELWLPTGGHVEPGEHPRATVVREAREELGIEARFAHDEPLFVSIAETVGKTAGHSDVALWYVLALKRTDTLRIDHTEFREARWFSFTEAPLDASDPHLSRFLAKLAATTQRAVPRTPS